MRTQTIKQGLFYSIPKNSAPAGFVINKVKRKQYFRAGASVHAKLAEVYEDLTRGEDIICSHLN